LAVVKGFSKYTRRQRQQWLQTQVGLSGQEIQSLEESAPEAMLALCDSMAENVVGCMALPFAVVPGCLIDKQHYVVPMVVEETSVVASLAKMAKWVSQQGGVITQSGQHEVQGQIHLPELQDQALVAQVLQSNEATWRLDLHQQLLANMARRGGGFLGCFVRQVPGQGLVVHVRLQTLEAMGANLVTQVCQWLKPRLAKLLQTAVGIAIVTNLADSSVVEARVALPQIDPQVGRSIEVASQWAQADSYRACTSNKGVCNGMDAVVLATGNDWRAVSAGAHAFAVKDGAYRSLTCWQMVDGVLHGNIKVPVAVGVVGGVTRNHPQASLALKLLGEPSRDRLASIVASVGLLQNLAALNALVTDSLVAGHMKLHVTNLMRQVGVSESMWQQVAHLCHAHLLASGGITAGDVQSFYEQALSIEVE
jgi:hydroxymethylglutaryl-CoA reductase